MKKEGFINISKDKKLINRHLLDKFITYIVIRGEHDKTSA